MAFSPLQNAYPLQRAAQGAICECAISGGVRLLDGENGKYMYCVESIEDFAHLYDPVKNRPGLMVSLVTNPALRDQIAACDPRIRADEFHQLHPTQNAPIVKAVEGVDFRRILAGDIEWILSVYDHPELTPDFIARRIAKAPSVLAVADGQPAGFFMTHCDAELGPAYVDPRLRGSGLADQLYARMLSQYRGHIGALPVIYVRLENHRSYKWLLRCGCVPSPERIVWFWHERES